MEIRIEEDIKRCEELIKPEHANWIGISNQLAIAHLIKRIKELENKYIIHLTDEQYRKLVDTIRKEEKEKLKQKIKDKKREIQKIGQYLYTNINVRNILEELLEEK